MSRRHKAPRRSQSNEQRLGTTCVRCGDPLPRQSAQADHDAQVHGISSVPDDLVELNWHRRGVDEGVHDPEIYSAHRTIGLNFVGGTASVQGEKDPRYPERENNVFESETAGKKKAGKKR